MANEVDIPLADKLPPDGRLLLLIVIKILDIKTVSAAEIVLVHFKRIVLGRMV